MNHASSPQTTLACLGLLLGALAVSPLHAAPANDNFADRITITGMTNTVNGSNVGATKETGEPNHFNSSSTNSAWWNWTAPNSGSVTMDTIGSSFDTVLAIYRNSVLTSLALVRSDDNSGGSQTSLATFTATAGTTYQIAVVGKGGVSGNITLTVRQAAPMPPTVTVTPASSNVVAGSIVSFTASATGATPFTYRWEFGGSPIAGATSSILTLTNVQPSQAGTYSSVVTNSLGAGTNSVVLSVAPAMVGIQPTAGIAAQGTRALFASFVSGPGPFGYQWHFGGAPIPAANAPSLMLTNVQPAQAGTYQLVVTNALGAATNSATLALVTPILVTNADDSGAGSLRDAIALANSAPGPDFIAFNIPGGGVQTVALLSRLPTVTETLVVDGATQPGYTGTPLIVLDSQNSSFGTLLDVATSGCVIRGLCFQRQPDVSVNLRSGGGNIVTACYIGTSASGGAVAGVTPNTTAVGISVVTSSNSILGNVISGHGKAGINLYGSRNVIQGNFIGTDAVGANAVANGSGILTGDGANALLTLIGGTTPGARNVISGNSQSGILLGYYDQDTTIQGNFIGTDRSGNARLLTGPSGTYGVRAQGFRTIIGGLGTDEANVISGHTNTGIYIELGYTNRIIGNLVGLGADGTTILGNGAKGIEVAVGPSIAVVSNRVSGHATAAVRVVAGGTVVQANIISSNAGKGLVIGGGIRPDRNSIFGNGGLAIDVGDDGPTPGEINGSGFITMTNVFYLNGSLTIRGIIGGTNPLGKLSREYRVQFFHNPPTDNPPQARTFVGEVLFAITTNSIEPQALVRLRPLFGKQLAMAAHQIGPASPSNAPPSAVFEFTFAGNFGNGDITGIISKGGSGSDADNTGEGEHKQIGTDPGGSGPAGSTPSSSANTPSHGVAGDPISTFTGELADQLPADVSLGGPMPLRFVRYYASLLKRDNLIAGKLGDNWLHNFEWTLTTTASNTLRIVNHTGRLIEFTNTGSSYLLIGLRETPFQLSSGGGNYTLGDPRSQRLHTFDNTGKLIQISDGHGNTHTLAYSGNQLASVGDGLGRTLLFSYSAGGALTNVSDGTRNVAFTQTGNNLTAVASPLGFTTSYAYDTGNVNAGLLTATTRSRGNVPWAQTFDAQGRVTNQVDGGQFTATLSYAGNTTTFTNPRGHVQTDVHSATGEQMSFTDESGQTIALGYNASQQRNTVTDRLGDTIGIAYHAPSGQPAAITNADGTLTLFSYVARTTGGVTFYDGAQTTYPDGTTEQFTYDANGNVLTRTDRAGKVWTFTYNARSQVLTAVNPTGGTTTFTYDAAGNLASRRDSDIGTTTYAYDQFSRLTNVVHPDSATMRMAWDANDRLASSTDGRGNTTTFTYDNNGNVVRITDALGNATGFAYDARDRMIRSTNRLGQVGSRAFGPLDQLIAVTNRNGNVTTYTYDARRRMTGLTDPGGRTWSQGYDSEDIPIATTNPLGQTSATGTDKLGYPVTATNALGHVTRVVRDALRRVTATVDGIGRTNGFGYDARGLLASATKPVIGTANYQRNDLGQLARITDLNGSQWDFSHTPMGREAGRTDPLARAQTMTYDSRGRPLRTVFPDGVTATNTYDGANNLTRRQYNDGTDYQFTYDALNRLVSANGLAFAYDAEGRLTNTASSGMNYAATYDADGRLTSVSYHNGAFTVNYTYDSRDRLVRVTDTLTGTQLDFAYDDAGRMTSLTRPNGVNGAYTYDAAGRLTRIQEGAIVDLQFSFDAARQITSVNHTAPLNPAGLHAPNAQTHTYDAAHQIRTPGHAYDARGRQTAAPGHSFQWDGASRLRQIDSVTLAYDGANNLQTRTAGGVTIRYYYNHAIGLAPIMAERNETTSQMQRYYVWTPGGRLLYAIDPANGNAASHYHFDQVGSTLALTAANGSVTDAYAYTPYGVLLGHTGPSTQPFTYVGAYGVRAEPAANLSHMRARYCETASSRFLSRDERWPRINSPLELNTYDYTSRRPLQFLDPLGREAFPAYERIREGQIPRDSLADPRGGVAVRSELAKGESRWYDSNQKEMRAVEAAEKRRAERESVSPKEPDELDTASKLMESNFDRYGITEDDIIEEASRMGISRLAAQRRLIKQARESAEQRYMDELYGRASLPSPQSAACKKFVAAHGQAASRILNHFSPWR